MPNRRYPDRWAITEELIPIVARELEDLVAAGCAEITVDEPSMSCYAHREDTKRFVDIFNRTVEPVAGKCRLSTHLCFGNYKGHAVGLRQYAPMFPDFLEFNVAELHLEMGRTSPFFTLPSGAASRTWALITSPTEAVSLRMPSTPIAQAFLAPELSATFNLDLSCNISASFPYQLMLRSPHPAQPHRPPWRVHRVSRSEPVSTAWAWRKAGFP